MLIEVKVPVLPESITEATLVNWHKKAGDAVKRDENLVDIETDKVVLELPAPDSGVLTEIRRGDGSTVTAQEVIAVLDTGAQTAAPGGAAAAKPAPAVAAAATSTANPAPAPGNASAAAKSLAAPGATALPAARKMMAEQNLSAADVAGTGRGGRITKEDVVAATQALPAQADRPQAVAAPAAKAPAAPSAVQSPASLGARPEQRVPMSRLRQRVAERLVQSQSTAAILTTFNEVNMAPVIELRNRYKDRFEREYGVKLGFMGFFIKAAVHALKKFPAVNASIDKGPTSSITVISISVSPSAARADWSSRSCATPIRCPIADIEKQIAKLRQARAGRQADRARATRHLHDFQRRRVRLDAVDADHQSAAIGDPRRACDARARSSRTGRSSSARSITRRSRMTIASSMAARRCSPWWRSGSAGGSGADAARSMIGAKDDGRVLCVVVIGAGPGGYTAAIRAAAGFQGCVHRRLEDRREGKPAWRYLHQRRMHSVEGAAAVKSPEITSTPGTPLPTHGIEVNALALHLSQMRSRKDKGVRQNNDGIVYLFKKNKIAFFNGTGSFVAANGSAGWQIVVSGAGNQTLAAKHVIIATGSKPRALPGAPFDNRFILDNEGALAIPEVPKTLGVIGAGVIGLEMGSVWRRLGAEVTVLEALPVFLAPPTSRSPGKPGTLRRRACRYV
jgi:2-oxoglutarate dehydrogenase E2 component (dihydrolipoamide succinyltransferase)